MVTRRENDIETTPESFNQSNESISSTDLPDFFADSNLSSLNFHVDVAIMVGRTKPPPPIRGVAMGPPPANNRVSR